MNMLRNVALLLLVFSVIFPFCLLAQSGSAPDFTLKDLDGKDFLLSSLKGKVILLDFWAVYCPPCRDEIPGFIELTNTYKEKGLEVIGISVDRQTSKVKSFVESNKINYPILLHTKDVLEAYGGVQAIPTTFLIDRNFQIVDKHVGFTEKAIFEEKIKKLLGAESALATAASDIPVTIPETNPGSGTPIGQ